MSERREERKRERRDKSDTIFIKLVTSYEFESFDKNESLINDYLILFVSEIVEWCVVMDPRAPHSI